MLSLGVAARDFSASACAAARCAAASTSAGAPAYCSSSEPGLDVADIDVARLGSAGGSGGVGSCCGRDGCGGSLEVVSRAAEGGRGGGRGGGGEAWSGRVP